VFTVDDCEVLELVEVEEELVVLDEVLELVEGDVVCIDDDEEDVLERDVEDEDTDEDDTVEVEVLVVEEVVELVDLELVATYAPAAATIIMTITTTTIITLLIPILWEDVRCNEGSAEKLGIKY
jgi:hypothetical protein